MSESNISTNSNPKKVDNKAFILLVVIALLNAMGFTIIFPILPFIVAKYTTHPNDLAATIGWLTAAYGICQLIAAPGLGVLSDRFGRRPVLFICILGSAVGYLLLGFGGALWLLFLGRIIDGLTGGNFSVLFGYVADITEPQERGKYFGRLGAASGVGTIIGPAIGGLLATINYSAPFILAASVMLLSIIWGYFFLPESLGQAHRATSFSVRELNPFKQLASVFSLANLRWLLLAWFFYQFPFGILQSTLTVLMKDSLNFNVTEAGLVMTLVGAVDIFTQGVLVGRLVTLLGEVRLGIVALVLVGIGYLVLGSIALIATPILLIIGTIIFAGSGGLVENSIRGLISGMVGRSEQGRVSGATQSLQSLGYIIGPLVGGLIYTSWGHFQAYASSAFLIVLAIICVCIAIPFVRKHNAVTLDTEAPETLVMPQEA